MKPPKYFDYKNNRSIDLEKDGCNLNDWKNLHGKVSFAKHSKGFLVFLPPCELEVSDEYSEFDPYTIETNIESDFHRRRIECTLQMVKEAIITSKV